MQIGGPKAGLGAQKNCPLGHWDGQRLINYLFLTPSVLVVQKEQKFKGRTQKFRLSERKKIQRKNNKYKEDQKIQ